MQNVRISKIIFDLKVHQDLWQMPTQIHRYDDLKNVMQQIFFDHSHKHANYIDKNILGESY